MRNFEKYLPTIWLSTPVQQTSKPDSLNQPPFTYSFMICSGIWAHFYSTWHWTSVASFGLHSDRSGYCVILWRHFLNGGSLLSDDSSLCQGDIKRAMAMSFLLQFCQSKEITGLAQTSKKGKRPHLLGWWVFKSSVENACGRLCGCLTRCSCSIPRTTYQPLLYNTRSRDRHFTFVMVLPPSTAASKSH